MMSEKGLHWLRGAVEEINQEEKERLIEESRQEVLTRWFGEPLPNETVMEIKTLAADILDKQQEETLFSGGRWKQVSYIVEGSDGQDFYIVRLSRDKISPDDTAFEDELRIDHNHCYQNENMWGLIMVMNDNDMGALWLGTPRGNDIPTVNIYQEDADRNLEVNHDYLGALNGRGISGDGINSLESRELRNNPEDNMIVDLALRALKDGKPCSGIDILLRNIELLKSEREMSIDRSKPFVVPAIIEKVINEAKQLQTSGSPLTWEEAIARFDIENAGLDRLLKEIFELTRICLREIDQLDPSGRHGIAPPFKGSKGGFENMIKDKNNTVPALCLAEKTITHCFANRESDADKGINPRPYILDFKFITPDVLNEIGTYISNYNETVNK